MSTLYLQIKDDILKKIESGQYKQDQTIPTELELASYYQVSRPTIRHAIELLVDQGYLEKRKKRGTIVCKRKLEQEFTSIIASFDSQMHQKGLSTQTKVLSFHKENVNHEIKEALKLTNDYLVYKLVRLRYVDNQPNVLVTTYIPYNLFKEFENIDFAHVSLYDMFNKFNHPICKISRLLEVIKADETVSDLLNIEKDSPIFYFHSYGKDKQQNVIEYSISKYRGDINSFLFDLTKID